MAESAGKTGSPVIIALDYAERGPALALADQLEPALCRLKVGFELFSAEGPAIVGELVDRGYDVFLDLKFHDIPNTVAHACRVAADLGVWMLNVHALGGSRMMQAAREAVDRSASSPLLIAVTVLTSHTAGDLAQVGIGAQPDELVTRLAGLAMESGLDGVVCSAQEAAELRQRYPRSVLVTPGIRPDGSAADDQRRTMTPAEAIHAGSSYLVIGRPVTRAPDPLAILSRVHSGLVTDQAIRQPGQKPR